MQISLSLAPCIPRVIIAECVLQTAIIRLQFGDGQTASNARDVTLFSFPSQLTLGPKATVELPYTGFYERV